MIDSSWLGPHNQLVFRSMIVVAGTKVSVSIVSEVGNAGPLRRFHPRALSVQLQFTAAPRAAHGGA